MKYLFLFISSFGILIQGYCQTSFYLGYGRVLQGFQDSRFLNTQHYFWTNLLELGVKKINNKSLIGVSINGFVKEDIVPATTNIPMLIIGGNLRASYLHKIQPMVYLGGTWDFVDLNQRTSEDGSSIGLFYHSASDLMASVLYNYKFNDWIEVDFTSDLGIISLVKTAPSFTANMQQNVVNKGLASYQDSTTLNPYSIRYIDVKPIWQQFYLRTGIEVKATKWASIGYYWRCRVFWDNPGYPVTQAMHNFAIRVYPFTIKNKN